MNDLKTCFNPVIALGRLALSLFFLSLTCLIIYRAVSDYETNGIKQWFTLLIGAALFAAMFHMFFKAFIATTKNYLIQDNSIEEFNVLTFGTKTINKGDIKGFSTSTVRYRIWNFHQIIIYLIDGTKIDIMQFAYFNFKDIKPTLLGKNYKYLGDEPYIWKWPNSRVYTFDDC